MTNGPFDSEMDVPPHFVNFGFDSLVSAHPLAYNILLGLVILLEERRENEARENEANEDEANNDWSFDSTDQLLRNCDVDDSADWCVYHLPCPSGMTKIFQ